MARWIMLLLSVVGFAISFRTSSPGILALGLLLALGGLFGAVVAFAAARVESVSQGQSSRELSLVLSARKEKATPAPTPRVPRKADAGHGNLSMAAMGGGSHGRRNPHDDAALDGADGSGGD